MRLCASLSNEREAESVRACVRTIASCPFDLGERVIYERVENERKREAKNTYCTIGHYPRSANLVAFARILNNNADADIPPAQH